jgi:hypothetical protein
LVTKGRQLKDHVLFPSISRALFFCFFNTPSSQFPKLLYRPWFPSDYAELILDYMASKSTTKVVAPQSEDQENHDSDVSRDDGENFTRSRIYFWAIGCLNEFEFTISDNIKQLDLYFAARIKPLLDDKNLADWLDAVSLWKDPEISSLDNGIMKLAASKESVKKVETQRESLVNLQSQFRSKLETGKSLRDGVGILPSLVPLFLLHRKKCFYADYIL